MTPLVRVAGLALPPFGRPNGFPSHLNSLRRRSGRATCHPRQRPRHVGTINRGEKATLSSRDERRLASPETMGVPQVPAARCPLRIDSFRGSRRNWNANALRTSVCPWHVVLSRRRNASTRPSEPDAGWPATASGISFGRLSWRKRRFRDVERAQSEFSFHEGRRYSD